MFVGLLVTAGIGYYVQANEDLLLTLVSPEQVMNEDGEMVTQFSASGLWWFAAIAQLGIVLYLATFGRMNRIGFYSAWAVFAVYAALNGFTLAPLLYAYSGASVAQVFLITACTFGASALFGWKTKANLLSLRGFFLQGLIGLLIVLIVSYFFQSTIGDMVISFFAVALFIGLTAFDVQDIREQYESEGGTGGLAVFGALKLYLDFINLFIHILRLFGIFGSDD